MVKTTNKDSNYLARVIELKGLRKHSDADRLQCVDVNFQNVITGLDAKDGDVYVYFPVESSINKEFLAYTNSFRDKELNSDKTKTGFFDENGRVKSMKLRGEQSCGYIVPVETLEEFSGENLRDKVGESFDTLNNMLICEKYIPKHVRQQGEGNKAKQGQKPLLDRLVDGQVHLHVKTSNFRDNVKNINPEDIISITYKEHGTSWWSSRVKAKRKLSLVERILSFLGINVQKTEFDVIYGSRKVVKNRHLEDNKRADHYYGYDLWQDISKEVSQDLPKGFTLYGEYVGYDKKGGYIQKGFDYGCVEGQGKAKVYRVTQTNDDGVVTELSHPQMVEFCDKLGLEMPKCFFYGRASDVYPELELDKHWHENFISNLQRDYNEKDCYLCENKVSEEGIIIRKERLFGCESYKLKSFRFLDWETKKLDEGEVDIEEEN